MSHNVVARAACDCQEIYKDGRMRMRIGIHIGPGWQALNCAGRAVLSRGGTLTSREDGLCHIHMVCGEVNYARLLRA